MNEVLKEELTQALTSLVDVIGRMQADSIKAAISDMLPIEPREDDTFTPEEAAAYLRCSKEKVYKMVRQKEVQAHNIGSRIYIHKHHLDEWMEKGGSKACAEN